MGGICENGNGPSASKVGVRMGKVNKLMTDSQNDLCNSYESNGIQVRITTAVATCFTRKIHQLKMLNNATEHVKVTMNSQMQHVVVTSK